MKAIEKFFATLKVAKKQKSPKVTFSVKECEMLGEELEELQKLLKDIQEKYDKLKNKSSSDTKPSDNDVIIVKMGGEKFK